MAAAAKAASAAAAPSYTILRSIGALRSHLTPASRLASFDVTRTHLSIALSDASRQHAAPFGVLARTALPSADAKILSSAFAHIPDHQMQPHSIHALVVGVSPIQPHISMSYTTHLLQHIDFLPNLSAVLFYSEAHALRNAIHTQLDILNALKLIPDDLETRKRKRFESAMYPRISKHQLIDSVSSRAQISPTDVLHAVLRDLNNLKHKQ
ncbi:unnamed protein product [Agarophyton chilense]